MALIDQLEDLMGENNAVGFFRPGDSNAKFILVAPHLWHAMWRRINGGGGLPSSDWAAVTVTPEDEQNE